MKENIENYYKINNRLPAQKIIWNTNKRIINKLSIIIFKLEKLSFYLLIIKNCILNNILINFFKKLIF